MTTRGYHGKIRIHDSQISLEGRGAVSEYFKAKQYSLERSVPCHWSESFLLEGRCKGSRRTLCIHMLARPRRRSQRNMSILPVPSPSWPISFHIMSKLRRPTGLRICLRISSPVEIIPTILLILHPSRARIHREAARCDGLR